jgi:hypothetical protein
MQRRMTVTLAGEEVTLAATFDAAAEIMEKVHDPIAIARDAATEQSLALQGVVYDARFKWNVRNVPQVIYIGMKAAGDKRDLKAVQKMVFDHGLIESSGIAVQFVTILVTPHSEEAADTKGDGGAGE